MYNYEWDKETGGYILSTKVTGVTKEVRPVFAEELRFLGFDKKFGWNIPACAGPLMWAEGRRYIYFGECVGEAQGGGLYTMPVMKNVLKNINIIPVDIKSMVAKNENLLNGLVQKTLKDIYTVFETYRGKVDMFYVAFSGGKDSVVMLDLVQRALPHDAFDVVFGDTTMELSDTYENVKASQKTWSDLNWHTARTDFDATESWRFIGPPSRTIRWCCGVHKSAPSVMKIKEILARRRNCQVEDIKHFKVLAFLGVRAEESEARSAYQMISDGSKHAVQINCNPILGWGTGELFLYLLGRSLPLNRAYRKGLNRVGCILCPMASAWTDCIQNHDYPMEVAPFIEIIRDTSNKKFSTKTEWVEYMTDGGWKKRAGGKVLSIGENKITNISTASKETFIVKDANHSWRKWMVALGELVEVEKDIYSLRHGETTLLFHAVTNGNVTTFSFTPLIKTKETIRFMYLFKNVLNKTAYCKNCKKCMAECPNGALTITSNDIAITNCTHCGQCLDMQKGCIVARSISTGGENNVSVKNIDRYRTFGFRQKWVKIYFENPDEFWTNGQLGKDMFSAFERWGKESGLIDDKKAPAKFVNRAIELGVDNAIIWGLFYSNMAYASPIITWYIRQLEYDLTYSNDSMMIMLGDGLKKRTRRNALSSLKDTIKSSPIGWQLGQGKCEMKGRRVVSIKKTGWQEPEPLVILYCLYLFAEHSDGLYSFTLSELLDDSDEREAMSPKLIFGTDRDTLLPIIQGLANDHSDFIQVDFNKGIMENIFLVRDKSSSDVIDLI